MAAQKPALDAVEAALVRALVDLSDMGVGHALIGGLAMSVHTDPRFTRDVDFAVHTPTDEAAEALVYGLGQRGYKVQTVIEQKVLGRLATARLLSPGSPKDEVLVDLLMASCGIEGYVVASAKLCRLPLGPSVPIARVGHLVAMKLLAESDIRLQDRIDLRALRKVIGADDAELARDACIKIERLGTNRGKPLVKMLDDYLAQPYVKDEYEF